MADEMNKSGLNEGAGASQKGLEQKINEMRAERRGSSYHVEDEGFDLTTPVNGGHGNDERPRKRKKNNKALIGVAAILGVIVVGFLAWWLLVGMGDETTRGDGEGADGEEQVMSERELELQQQLAQSEFENLEKEFAQYEMSQQEIIVNDTLKQQLQRKYEQARLQVEELRSQLRDSANKSAAEIQKLNDQIRTLRELLKHYLEEIDRLNKENEQLRAENKDLRESLNVTSTSLAQAQKENENLSERMTLAEKLNVTGVSMNILNKKNKIEKKIKNAAQFVINFTIPQNNSTPVGTKTIYAVITTPEGQILDGAGSFSLDGSTVPASARKQIDYGGEEIGGIQMYYDIRNALTPGTYSVQLFCDGYALMARPLDVTFKN